MTAAKIAPGFGSGDLELRQADQSAGIAGPSVDSVLQHIREAADPAAIVARAKGTIEILRGIGHQDAENDADVVQDLLDALEAMARERDEARAERDQWQAIAAENAGERDKLRELLRGMLKLYDALPARLKPPAVTAQEEAARDALKGTT